MPEAKQDIADILIAAAKAGGKVVLSYYKTDLVVTEKSSKKDLLTQADLKSQEIIIETLTKLMVQNGFEEDEIGFIAEENFVKKGKHTFIVDPLDGTSSFVAQLPSFAVSIGYAIGNQIMAGVIYQPTENTIYFAEKNKGAFTIKNNQKIKLEIQEKTLKDSFAYYNTSSNQETTERLLKRLANLTPHILMAKQNPCISLNLIELAKNNVQIVINGRAKFWDIAAAKLIVEEAGGKVKNWEGNDFEYDYKNPVALYPLIASLPKLIDDVVKNFYEKPQIAIVGSMTHSFSTYPDRIKEGYGGGVSHGGKTAAALNISATIITIGADDIEPGLEDLRKLGLKTIRVKRNVSNNFSNDYRTENRMLRCRSFFTEPFSSDDFKEKLDCNAVILFPGLNEISKDTISEFNTKLVFLDVGGLTREIGEKNKEGFYPITQGAWNTIDGFRNKVDILKVSHEDLENIEFPKNIISEAEKVQNLADNGFPIVLLTRGKNPTMLARKNLPIIEIQTFELENGDPAGAGEVFSVGFMDEYLKTNDPVKAAAFGNACASYKISGEDYNYEKAKQRAEGILQTIS
jgi:myo-inositol-1(or 4)-monophosphatase